MDEPVEAIDERIFHSGNGLAGMPEQWGLSMATTFPRTNHHMAAIVDQGIAIAEQSGFGQGYVFMRDNNVPLAVVLRVLSEPEHRRQLK